MSYDGRSSPPYNCRFRPINKDRWVRARCPHWERLMNGPGGQSNTWQSVSTHRGGEGLLPLSTTFQYCFSIHSVADQITSIGKCLSNLYWGRTGFESMPGSLRMANAGTRLWSDENGGRKKGKGKVKDRDITGCHHTLWLPW
jgi:hypothetical protein